jgi:ribonuclease P/MRP protein subunit RPP1
MYEAVRPADGDASAFATTAARMGYEGLVALGTPDADVAADVDLVDGVEVRDDPVGATVGRLRSEHTLVCVRGGDGGRNRAAVEDERVDVLTRPLAEGDVNHVLADLAAENGVRIEFDLSAVLRATGGRRVRAIRGLRKLRDIVVARDAPYVVSAGATDRLHLRAPRELVAVGEVVGFDAETVRAGLREWGALAARNRHRQSDSFITPGVERGRYEEDA